MSICLTILMIDITTNMSKYNLTKKTQRPNAECWRCKKPIYIGDLYYTKRSPYEICLDCFDENTDTLYHG